MTPPDRPDLTVLPNFDALEEWVGRLRAWATAIQVEWQADKENLAELQTTVDTLEREGRDQRNAMDELETLHEQLLDVDRGLITLDAVLREIRIDQAYR